MSTTTDDEANPLTEISSATELDFYIRGGTSDNDGIVIVTFSTHWCGPCQRSKPKLIELAKSYHHAAQKEEGSSTSVSFAYVPETDMNDDFVDEYNINAFPTYICFAGEEGKEIDRVEGANLDGVEAMIKKHLRVS